MDKKLLTLDDLINNKLEIQERIEGKFQVEIDELGGLIEFKCPDAELLNDIYSGSIKKEESDNHLIYYCSIKPDLTDKKLHEAYNIPKDNPKEIVNEIFKAGTRNKIAKELFKRSEFNKKLKVIDSVKN